MMRVVDVTMLVLERLVGMFMRMHFGQVEVDAEPHQHAGNDELYRERVVKDGKAEHCADERCGGEIR